VSRPNRNPPSPMSPKPGTPMSLNQKSLEDTALGDRKKLSFYTIKMISVLFPRVKTSRLHFNRYNGISRLTQSNLDMKKIH